MYEDLHGEHKGRTALSSQRDMTVGEHALILAVASRNRNLQLIHELLKQADYEVVTADTVEEFDTLLEEMDTVSLTILDVDGFTTDIWERCERLNELGVPVMVLARQLAPPIRQRALSLGARNMLEKPVRKAELRNAVQALVA